MRLLDLGGAMYTIVSGWLSNQHNIPPFYDINEAMLVLFVLGVSFNQFCHFLSTPLVLLLTCIWNTLLYRWQMYASYAACAAISIINYNNSSSNNNNNTTIIVANNSFNVVARFSFLIIAFVTLAICTIFPMVAPVRPESGEVGVQDVVLGDSKNVDDENAHFYVRFYYPTANRAHNRANHFIIIAFLAWFVMAYTAIIADIPSAGLSLDARISVLVLLTGAVRHITISLCKIEFMEYMPGGLTVLQGVAKFAELPFFLFMHMACMTTQTFADAPIVLRDDVHRDEPRLVYFFSGLGGSRSSYSSTCIHLAHLGYIVAVAEFTDGTPACTVMPSGLTRYYTTYRVTSTDNVLGHDLGCFNQWRYRNNQLLKRSTEMTILNKFIFNGDSSCIKAVVYKSAQGTSSNFLDTFTTLSSSIRNVFLYGHSFGGATAAFLNTSAKEPAAEFRKSLNTAKIAGMCLCDPWLYPLDDTEAEFSDTNTRHSTSSTEESPNAQPRFRTPLLTMHTDLFQWAYNLDKENKLTSCYEKALQIRIRDAGHYNYNEIGLLSPFVTAKMKKNGAQEPLELLSNINKAIGVFTDNVSEHFGSAMNTNAEKKAHLLSKSLNSIQRIKTFEVLKANW